MARKFKLGDEVVIKGNADGSRNKIGDIGRVIDVEPDDYPGDLTYRVHVPSRGNLENWHIEQDLELTTEIKQTIMIDYKKAGTVLPKIPHGIEYRAVNWSSTEPNSTLTGGFDKDRIVSYGSKEVNGEVYILADTRGYAGSNYYMFKESTILELEKDGKGKLIGYNLAKPEYKKAALEIANADEFGSADGTCDFKINSTSYHKIKAAGLLDLWFEPVYEKKEKTITDNQDREAKVVEGKLLVADGELSLEDLKKIRDRFDDDVVGSNNWSIGFVSATFDIGCWKGVTLADINKAIEAIESF